MERRKKRNGGIEQIPGPRLSETRECIGRKSPRYRDPQLRTPSVGTIHPLENAFAIVANGSSLSAISCSNAPCCPASCALLFRISRMTPCVRAQFGQCDSFSPRQLRSGGGGLHQHRTQQSLQSRGSSGDPPLVIRVSAHEVDCRQVELSSAGRTARDLEDPRRVRIGQLLNLLALLGRFGSVGRDKGLVLRGAGIESGKARLSTPPQARTDSVSCFSASSCRLR